jgi:CRISPR-associated protein Csm3
MKLTEIRKIEGTITLKSGLHIGSGNMEMHIGGTDSPVIKHPHTLEPYIPGSSLKGKVRSLLEMASGLMVKTEGGVVSKKILNTLLENEKKEAEEIIKIFGSGGDDNEEETGLGPGRVSFADCYLDEEWKKMARQNRWEFTEVKSENTIDRIRGTAKYPRFIERVPEGTKFNFTLTFKILETDDEALFNKLLTGLKLLEYDSLGGSGSRGYGRIKIDFKDDELKKKFENLTPFQAIKKEG